MRIVCSKLRALSREAFPDTQPLYQRRDGDAALGGLIDQLLHIFQGAEHGVDGAVVGDVVAVVHLRRLVDGGKPNAVNTQFFEHRKFRHNAFQIAETVSVGVAKAFCVNFVKYAVGAKLPIDWYLPVQSNHIHKVLSAIDNTILSFT